MQPKSLEHYLSQEEPRLLNHLKISGAIAQLPYSLWFRRCFAGCLPESSLQRSVYLISISANTQQGFIDFLILFFITYLFVDDVPKRRDKSHKKWLPKETNMPSQRWMLKFVAYNKYELIKRQPYSLFCLNSRTWLSERHFARIEISFEPTCKAYILHTRHWALSLFSGCGTRWSVAPVRSWCLWLWRFCSATRSYWWASTGLKALSSFCAMWVNDSNDHCWCPHSRCAYKPSL